MGKTPQSDADADETSNPEALHLRIKQLEDALAAANERVQALQDKLDGNDVDAKHVEVRKGAEMRKVHPATVEAHKAAGWERV